MASDSKWTILADGVNDVIGGVKPTWGPFGALGNTSKVIIGVIAAIVLAVSAGTFLLGVAKSKGWFGSGNSTMHTDQGKGQIVGGLAGIFLVASAATIFGLVYGMGI
ncbi:hypothetical protein CIB93_30750 [Streptomyces sp. WZ.A104]|uniref:hypothetical protein n=1 Tax=unclassified Streptomyces TaxID=2593676 RepID=UPI0009333860|nr:MULTISPECIES: hypothetical protein [unclassified Streptomyces]PCG82289.1 hypothetical protein CIB93_30750 [Streptomyces sp. WZ.A104]